MGCGLDGGEILPWFRHGLCDLHGDAAVGIAQGTRGELAFAVAGQFDAIILRIRQGGELTIRTVGQLQRCAAGGEQITEATEAVVAQPVGLGAGVGGFFGLLGFLGGVDMLGADGQALKELAVAPPALIALFGLAFFFLVCLACLICLVAVLRTGR